MDLHKYLERFTGLDYAFAYGSGVYRQKGYTDEEMRNSMVDFIISTKNINEWHLNNKKTNPRDYSILKHLSGKCLGSVTRMGGQTYFNTTLVPIKEDVNRKMKYGVISIDDLCDDLENWTTLYIAGRLHKPVNILIPNSKVSESFQKNLDHAVNVALYFLPEQFTERDLYRAICGLSYMGDIRMAFAENPHKVENIVTGSYPFFHDLYKPVIERNPFIQTYQDHFIQDLSLVSQSEHLARLPLSLQPVLEREIGLRSFKTKNNVYPDIQSGYYHIMKTTTRPTQALEGYYHQLGQFALTIGVSRIVCKSSIAQATKGFFTLGTMKSLLYVSKKITKAFK